MSTITIGVDLAKSMFSVCAVDVAGHVQRRQDLGREAFALGLAKCRRAPWWRWKPAAVRTTGRGAVWRSACSHD